VTLREALALALLYASCRDERVRQVWRKTSSAIVRILVPALDEAMVVLDRLIDHEHERTRSGNTL
jgi:hypothetical protein